MADDIKKVFLQSYKAVIDRVHPNNIWGHVREVKPPQGRVIVVGAGKASAAMAVAFERHYPWPVTGLVVTRYGYTANPKKIEVIEASHPIPDEAGVEAAHKIIKLIETTTPNDLIICLLSGGGSALMTAPVEGVSFFDLQHLTNDLLACGAEIAEINTVRKHLNLALGGGLARAAGNTPMMTIAISDVVGDDPSIIASGATVADPSTLADARAVLEKYNITPEASIIEALNNPANESLKPGHPIFENKLYMLVASAKQGLEAAAEFWKNKGVEPIILGADITGETNDVALEQVARAKDILRTREYRRPWVLLSGGETTVTLKNKEGAGGPNTQFVLQAAMALEGVENIYAMAVDTDGIDGSHDNSGAFTTPETLQKAKALGLEPRTFLESNNSYKFFKQVGGLIKVGPTRTNVNDYRAILALPEEGLAALKK